MAVINNDPNLKWGKQVPYVILDNAQTDKNSVEKYISEFNKKFDYDILKNRTNETDYIKIKYDGSPGSQYIGNWKGEQTVEFRNQRTFLHELLHALGFAHEQNHLSYPCFKPSELIDRDFSASAKSTNEKKKVIPIFRGGSVNKLIDKSEDRYLDKVNKGSSDIEYKLIDSLTMFSYKFDFDTIYKQNQISENEDNNLNKLNTFITDAKSDNSPNPNKEVKDFISILFDEAIQKVEEKKKLSILFLKLIEHEKISLDLFLMHNNINSKFYNEKTLEVEKLFNSLYPCDLNSVMIYSAYQPQELSGELNYEGLKKVFNIIPFKKFDGKDYFNSTKMNNDRDLSLGDVHAIAKLFNRKISRVAWNTKYKEDEKELYKYINEVEDVEL